MHKVITASATVIALFTFPAFAQNSCEKPDPTDTVTTSEVGTLHD
jgi:hypothetical protein